MKSFKEFTEINCNELNTISGGKNKAAYEFGKSLGQAMKFVFWPVVTHLS